MRFYTEDIYCPCGKWIGVDHPDTHTDPGYFEGVSDFWSDKLGRYCCSPGCLNEFEEEASE